MKVKSIRVILMTVVCILFMSVFVTAGVVDLPGTGQTTSYATGDDGDLEMGVAWPSPRFTVSGDCVTDTLTGLMWVRSPDSIARTWQDALNYANGLSLCGYTDWRLPNVNELESLINAGQSDLATWLNTQGFSNVQSSYYWSSTSDAYSTSRAWVVSMWYGDMGPSNKSNYRRYVWPVRSGQSGLFGSSLIQLAKTGQTTSYAAGDDGYIQAGVVWPSPRFTDNGDGTAADNLTGLMWTKDASLMISRDPSFDADWTVGDGRVTWQHALDYVAKLNAEAYLGYTDWRLPNVLEIKSLINAGQSDLATWLNTQGFSNVQSDHYWSSTSYADDTNSAWIVIMLTGFMNDGSKSYSHYVWPVRSGQVGPSVHSILGSATENGIGMGGATLTLSGCASAMTATAPDGSYSFTNLADGSCTVTPSLNGHVFTPPSRLVTVAGADVTGQDFSAVQTWFEEPDPAITYTGTWGSMTTCTSCSSGGLAYSNQTGARAEFSFNGTGIKWIVTRAKMMGKVKVYFDGVYVGMVDLYTPTPKFQQVLQATGLSPGNHTVILEVSGQKNRNATGFYINIDAFEVMP